MIWIRPVALVEGFWIDGLNPLSIDITVASQSASTPSRPASATSARRKPGVVLPIPGTAATSHAAGPSSTSGARHSLASGSHSVPSGQPRRTVGRGNMPQPTPEGGRRWRGAVTTGSYTRKSGAFRGLEKSERKPLTAFRFSTASSHRAGSGQIASIFRFGCHS